MLCSLGTSPPHRRLALLRRLPRVPLAVLLALSPLKLCSLGIRPLPRRLQSVQVVPFPPLSHPYRWLIIFVVGVVAVYVPLCYCAANTVTTTATKIFFGLNANTQGASSTKVMMNSKICLRKSPSTSFSFDTVSHAPSLFFFRSPAPILTVGSPLRQVD